MSSSPPAALAERFRAARRDPGLAVLEGLHALKHAARFDAEFLEIVMVADSPALPLAAALAPDLLPLLERAVPVEPATFAALAPVAPDTGVIAIARRRESSAAAVLAQTGTVVVLERPTHAGNIGAVVRVAAAAGAAGVLAIGGEDPWSPAALRGGAGLQYALGVARSDTLPPLAQPLIAVHPEGEPLFGGTLPRDACYLFGSERSGLSDAMLARATRTVRIPMRAGVSSLNLATAVAIVLYALPGAGADR